MKLIWIFVDLKNVQKDKISLISLLAGRMGFLFISILGLLYLYIKSYEINKNMSAISKADISGVIYTDLSNLFSLFAN